MNHSYFSLPRMNPISRSRYVYRIHAEEINLWVQVHIRRSGEPIPLFQLGAVLADRASALDAARAAVEREADARGEAERAGEES